MRRARAILRYGFRRSGLRCKLAGQHRPARDRISWYCACCRMRAPDLDYFGYFGNGYVSPLRRVYVRDVRNVDAKRRSSVTRTDAWEPTATRGW